MKYANKYHNKPVEVDGIRFDSQKEATRWKELQLLQRAGKISELQRQVPFKLLPAQYRTIFDRKAHRFKERCVEREVTYVADFVYVASDGKTVVEDTKGVRTKEYVIKRKLMLFFLDIRIAEV